MSASDVRPKTRPEIARIRRAGRVVAKILASVEPYIQEGYRPVDLEHLCDRMIHGAGAKPCMRGFKGYPASIAVSVNDVIAHGVPDDRPFHAGDVVTLDVAVDIAGWKADGAWSYLVPGAPPGDTVQQRRLLDVAWQCSLVAIAVSRPGYRFGDVGQRVARHAGAAGFVVMPQFTGHGIGRELHEDPVVHFAGGARAGLPIVPGLVFTVEPVLGTIDSAVPTEDHHGYRTSDGSSAAQFEHTVAVSAGVTEILTMPSIDVSRYTTHPPEFRQS